MRQAASCVAPPIDHLVHVDEQVQSSLQSRRTVVHDILAMEKRSDMSRDSACSTQECKNVYTLVFECCATRNPKAADAYPKD